jgi:Uri superfamily endonuclease
VPSDAEAERGTYTLLVGLDAQTSVRFGSAGERELAAGGYAYTGSAFGPGGFARLERHRAIAAGDHDVRHWHVDHLLHAAGASVAGDVRSPGAHIECAVAARLRTADGMAPVAGIGASDCDCDTHLVRAATVDAAERAARIAHRTAE